VVKAHRVTSMADIDIDAVRKQKKAEYKSKLILSIFNDENTESFICLCYIAAMHIILRVLVVLYLRVTCICVA
jgi:hypothetical protein